MKKVVLIASGGLDSTTILAMLMKEECEIYPISFNYGQRHSIEQKRLTSIARFYYGEKMKGVLKPIYMCQLPRINCLLTSEEDIPEGDVNRTDVALTYVPGRNLIFISHALSYAEVLGAEEVYIGVNYLDYSGYPDCRPEFIQAVNDVSKVGTEIGIKGKPITVMAPLMHKTKKDIIKLGMSLKTPYHLTWSCYKGGYEPCGVCDSCKLRAKGFKEAGYRDPSISKME